MNKKGWTIVLIIACIVAIGAVAIPKLLEEGVMTFGWPEDDFIVLKNGTYTFEDLKLNPNSYAIYALSGTGVVDVDGSEYPLDSALFAQASRQSFVKTTVLYQESPKVEIQAKTTLVVSGDPEFQISFLKR